MAANDTVGLLADDYWETTLEANPTMATMLGDHRFDDRIEDPSADGEADLRSKLARFSARLDAIEPANLDRADRLTCRQLAQELGDAIAVIDHRMAELQSDQMTGLHINLLIVAPSLSAPDPESAAKLVQRLRQVPTALEQAGQRFLDGIGGGRTPARVCIERSLNTIDGYVSSPLDDDPFVRLQGPDSAHGWQGEADWRSQLVEAVRHQVRPAYAALAELLRERLLPVARDDEHCGLAALDDGPELYRILIRHHTSIDTSADALHRFGLDEVTEKLPAEYATIGGRLFGPGDLAATFERLRHDRKLRFQTPVEILDVARANVASASDAMGDWFGRLPRSPCVVEPVPPFLADDSPVGYYVPPAADGSRPGTYFVNTGAPEEKTRYEAASVAFHEAIPGHHLQLTIASELEDLPAFRRFSLVNAAFCEGWGLYAERLAEEMSLYQSDMDRAGMLAADSWRSCRLVVDTGLHALGWSRAQAIAFMTANMPASPSEIAVEVDRYIGMPGQALAYKVGQREIFRLRERARSGLGSRFEIKDFHDIVLGGGSVGLTVLRTVVEEWLAEQMASTATL